MQRTSNGAPIVDWQSLPVDQLERQFNPRVAVADAQEQLAARAAESVRARARITGEYDLRYGPGPKQTFDLHRPHGTTGAPAALIFVHGGYWRALDKSDCSYLAPAFLDAGIAFVNLNYDLCPGVTLSELTREVLDGIQYVAQNADRLGVDGERLFVMGHSAGAHSAAMALAQDWRARGLARAPLRGAICISGIYDARVVPLLSVNQEVGLTPELAEENNALARKPLGQVPVLVTVGADEPPAWIGQSLAYYELCRAAGLEAHLEIVPGANHFTVLSWLADAGHGEHRRVLDFIRGP